MKIILILLVILSQSVFAVTKTKEKVSALEDTVTPEEEIPANTINTSPNPVPQKSDDAQGTILEGGKKAQKQQEAPFEVGPYDKDGKYTYPKHEETNEGETP